MEKSPVHESAVGNIFSASSGLQGNPSNLRGSHANLKLKSPPAPDQPFQVSTHSPMGYGAITGPDGGAHGSPCHSP